MSIYDDINPRIRATIRANDSADILSPTFVAAEAYREYAHESDDMHVKYGAIEHFKQMARRELASRFSADGDDNPTHQQDMFSGTLQDRYPIPTPRGSDPIYKLRELMSAAELEWNVRQLEKSADARVQHAAALRAYMDMRQAS